MKTQITYLEGLTETIDEKQQGQIEGYEIQAKHVLEQLGSLNLNVEEMNQEILSILKQLTTNKKRLATNSIVAPAAKKAIPTTSDRRIKPRWEISQTNQQPLPASNHLSFSQLRNLSRHTTLQSQSNTGLPVSQNVRPEAQQAQQYLNSRYAQSTHSQLNFSQNGFHKDTTLKSNFPLKGSAETQEASIIQTTSTNIAPIINNAIDTDKATPIVEEDISANAVASIIVDDAVSVNTVVDDVVSTNAAVPVVIDDDINANTVAPTIVDDVSANAAVPVVVDDDVSVNTVAPTIVTENVSTNAAVPVVVDDDVSINTVTPTIVVENVSTNAAVPVVVDDDVNANTVVPGIVDEDVSTNAAVPLVMDDVNSESTASPVTESFEDPEPLAERHDHIQTTSPTEAIHEEVPMPVEAGVAENKKNKHSSFFNFFRKRNE
ncbi:MAG: hypothetical protein RR651_02345 [Lysinibacillus sp.]